MKPILLTTLAAAALMAGCGVNGRDDVGSSSSSTNGTPGSAATNAATSSSPAVVSVPAPAASTVPTPATPPASLPAGSSPATPNTAVATVAAAAAAAPTNAPVAPVASPPLSLPKPPPELPASVQEVVRLAQTSVADDVIVAYIERNSEPMRLNVDQIILLRDMGLSMKVIQALIKQDAGAVAAMNTTNAPVQNVVIQSPAPAPVPAPAPAPDAANSVAAASVQAPPTAAVPGQGNVLLPNYSAATAGAPAIQNAPLAPAAPVYQPGPTPVQGAAPVVVEQAPQTVPSTTYFYESLSPYGSWVQVSGYGWCWQPSVAVVNTSWRPYCDDGHWLWTDNGWYWQSNYSWGWAAFHYGRWHRHQLHGWVWNPGTVWGPAWVTWRYSDSYCGWAPLPPEADWDVRFGLCYRGSRVSLNFGWGLGYDHFSCVSFSHFHHREVWRHCAPRDRNVTIINNPTIINNYGNDRHSVVNRGVDKAMVERHSRDEIRKVDIRDTAQPTQASRLVKEGDRAVAVNAFRPTLASHASAPPARILERQQPARPVASAASGIASGGTLPSRPSTSSGFTPTPANTSRPSIQEPPSRSISTPSPARTSESTRSPQPVTARPSAGPSRQEVNRNNARPDPSARPQYQSPLAPNASQPAPISRPVGTPPASRPVASPNSSPNSSRISPEAGGLSRTEVRKPQVAPSARADYSSGIQTPASSGAQSGRPDSTSGSSFSGRPATTSTPATRSDVVRPAGRVESAPTYREPARPSPSSSAPAERSSAAPAERYSPSPRSAPSPSYSAPVQRSAPSPSPSYSAPAPRPAPAQSPSYSAPVTRSAPVQSAPPPARSEGSAGQGGGGGRPSRSTREN